MIDASHAADAQASPARARPAPARPDPEDGGVAGADPLATVAQLARRLIGGERASLLLPHHAPGVLRIVSASGLPHTVIARTQVRVGDPVAGLVAETRRPLLGTMPATTGRSGRYRTSSFVSVPVSAGGGHFGVLSVADPSHRAAFHDEDVAALQDLATFVAHQIASAASQRSVLQQLIQVREDERRRVAQDLHDAAGHALTAAILRIDLDAARLTDDPTTARAALDRARLALLESTALLHDTAYALRPRILDDLGLLPALRSLVAHAEAGGMPVRLRVTGPPERLDAARELAVFRVVQEALTNVQKHARAACAWVSLRFEVSGLTVIVEDDGVGFARPVAHGPGLTLGLGLAGMRERVEVLDGTFTIATRPRGGTRLVATVPRQAEAG